VRERYGLGEIEVSAEHYRLYVVHDYMMLRCYEPGHKGYENHEGRGIGVWQPWHDVQRFIEDIEHDLRPHSYGMTLDRIDNDGDYEPGNVRWATWSEQRTNTRSG